MEIGSAIAIGVILIALLLFGLYFNAKIAEVENTQIDHGYTAIFVVIGVSVTLVGIALIDFFVDWNAGLIGLIAFVASGSPMAAGSFNRYLQRQAEQKRRMQELALASLREDENAESDH